MWRKTCTERKRVETQPGTARVRISLAEFDWHPIHCAVPARQTSQPTVYATCAPQDAPFPEVRQHARGGWEQQSSPIVCVHPTPDALGALTAGGNDQRRRPRGGTRG